MVDFVIKGEARGAGDTFGAFGEEGHLQTYHSPPCPVNLPTQQMAALTSSSDIVNQSASGR